MFHRFITWVMLLLKTIWISEKIETKPIEKPTIPLLEIETGDPTLELLISILEYGQHRPTLSSDPFDPILYRSIETQFDNYAKLVSLLNLVHNYLQEQTEKPDDNIYLDDPLIVGLARGVVLKKEIGAFLIDGAMRDIHSAFYKLLALTSEVHTSYMLFKDHPTLSIINKDYGSRNLEKAIFLIKQHMDLLYSHGKLDDSEKETHQSQSNSH